MHRDGQEMEHPAPAPAATRRDLLKKAVDKAAARIARRIEAVKGDLSAAESAQQVAERAQFFVAQAARTPRGAPAIIAVDWSSGEAREVRFAVDPARGAKEQIEAVFKRARRLKQGLSLVCQRLTQAQAAHAGLAALRQALEEEADDAQLDAIEQKARATAPKDFKVGALPSPARSRRAQGKLAQEHPPYRTFRGASGARILVGRNADKNDELTLHVARPQDLWLHAKDRAGAHVVVPLAKNTTCPADLLIEAAHLAAHFSDARDETLVDVQYVPKRYVRKPRGSPPGLVVLDREKVLLLRREEARLRQLLDHEEPP